MTIRYKCAVKFDEYEHLTDELISAAIAALKAAGYCCYRGATGFDVDGELNTDEETADDIADEIRWILWDSAEIDADASAECTDEYDWRHSPFAEQMREFERGLA